MLLPCAALCLPLACGAEGETTSESESAIGTKHVLVVGPLSASADGGIAYLEPSPGDARADAALEGADAIAAAHEDHDDDVEEPEPGQRAASDGALVRRRRVLGTKAECLLGPGAYDLTQAPRRSDDGVFWHVIFSSETRGLGGEACGGSGWVEARAVAFRQRQVAGEPAAPDAPRAASATECGRDPSFRPAFVKPVHGPITGRFGDCRDGCRRRHAGLDIAAASGTPLLAAERGQIVDARTGVGACGTVIEVRHPNGSSTRFCHNSRLVVRKGACVARGQKIAEVGNTGVGTGPHMHMEYYPSPTGGAADPRRLFGY